MITSKHNANANCNPIAVNAHANTAGIILMCVAMGLGATNDVLVKLLSDTLTVPQIMTLRGVFVCSLSLAWVIATGYGRSLAQLRNPLVILRSTLEAFSSIAFFLALAQMPIGDLTALMLLTPLLIATGASIFFGEKISLSGWSAIFAGFIGMLMVVKPGSDSFSAYVFYGLAAAVLTAVRDLLTRKIKTSVSSLVVCFSAGLGNMILGLVMTVFAWSTSPVTLDMLSSVSLWLGLLIAAVVVTLANYGVILAFRQSKASVVSPFRYSSLLWSMLAGVAIWGEVPDAIAIAGSMIIIGSGLYLLRSERAETRKLRLAMAETVQA